MKQLLFLPEYIKGLFACPKIRHPNIPADLGELKWKQIISR
jgi:hypothetical protein